MIFDQATQAKTPQQLVDEIDDLRRRLQATEDILHAVQNGQVNTVVVSSPLAYQTQLLAHVHDAIFAVDADSRITFWNEGAEALYGWRSEEAVGKSLQGVLRTESMDVQPDTVTQQIVDHGHAHSRVIHFRKDGMPVYVEEVTLAVRNAQGQIVDFVTADRDVTEQRQTEEALRASERRFRLAVDNFPGVFIIYDGDRRIQFINMPGMILSGLPEKALLGHTDEEIFPPEVAAAYLPLLERALETGTVQTAEMQVAWPAGMLAQRVTYVPLLDEQGNIHQVLGVAEDITERKQAEEALRRLNAELEQRVAERTTQLEAINARLKNEIIEHAHTETALRKSEQQFRLLAEHAQDLIYRIRTLPQRGFEYVSPSASQITGYTPEEHYADPELGFRLIFAEDQPIMESALQGDIPSGTPVILRLARRDGAIVWTEQRMTPIFDAQHQIVALEGIARDITERRQAEEALRLSEERFRMALKNAPLTVTTQDRDLRYTWFYNPVSHDAADRFLGWTDIDVLPVEEAARLTEIKRKVLETGAGAHQEGWLTLSREPQYFDFTVEALRNALGEIDGVTTVLVNITERKRAEDALEHANENLMVWANELEHRNREMSQLNEMGNLLESCLTAEEAYQVIAHSARILFPEDAGALYVLNASKNLVEAVATWGDPEGQLVEQVFAADDCWALRRGRTHVVEHSGVGLLCAHVRPDANRIAPPFAYLCVPMLAQGETLGVFFLQSGVLEANQPRGDRSVLSEAKERLAVSIAEHVALALSSLRLRETLRRQAIRDPLTGLFNRRYMEESLEREIRRATRRKTTVGIIMLDLDHFKRYNDDFGHEVGDAILRTFGTFLSAHIRGGDIACRYGGEEFTLILPETSLEETQERAEQIRGEIKKIQVDSNGHSFGNLSASLGVAIFPEQGEMAESILRAADVALYRAKSAGRDRVVTAEGLV